MRSIGELGQCLMDIDSDIVRRGRIQRSFGLGTSIAFEALMIFALVLVSLTDSGILPKLDVITSIPAPIFARPPQTPRVALRQPSAVSAHLDMPIVPVSRRTDPTAVQSAEAEGLAPVIPAAQGDLLSTFGLGSSPARPISEGPPAPSHPVPVSSGVMEASLLNRVQPLYPASALAARIPGRVELNAIIAADGTVHSLQVVRGNPFLVQAALSAVRQWRYRPTLLNGVPVEVETIITVDFILQ